MAARPTGMFAQKIPRQPTDPTSTPPSTGPSAMERPNTPSQTPIARARSARPVKVFVMMPSAAGLSIEPPTPCSTRKAMSQPRLGARLHIHEPRVNNDRADLEDRPAADPVGERAGQHQQGRQHDRVGGHRPLQAGDAGVQVAADRRQPDVHDRVVQADHEQAHAADGQHERAAPVRRGARSARTMPDARARPRTGTGVRSGSRPGTLSDLPWAPLPVPASRNPSGRTRRGRVPATSYTSGAGPWFGFTFGEPGPMIGSSSAPGRSGSDTMLITDITLLRSTQ